MSKRKHTKARPARPQTRVTFYRRRKQQKAPQPAPEATTAAQQAPRTLDPRDMTPAQLDRCLYLVLKIWGDKAKAPEFEPNAWSEKSTPETSLAMYRKMWDLVGRMPEFDRRDILTPEELEERIHRTLAADLLADVDLSDFAA